MRLCAAQLRPVAGDFDANLRRHAQLVGLAASRGADLVFFPELSLTGYEPTLAERLAGAPEDVRLGPLQALSDSTGIVIGAGLPVRAAGGVRIGMVFFQPGRPRLVYCKQQLHADERPFFVPCEGQLVIGAGGHALAPAICYESLQPGHAAAAAALGADVYLASVAKSARNVEQAFAHYPDVARGHKMTVLMANCVGPCHDFHAAGRSAVWNAQGERLVTLDEAGEGIAIADTVTGQAQAWPIDR